MFLGSSAIMSNECAKSSLTDCTPDAELKYTVTYWNVCPLLWALFFISLRSKSDNNQHAYTDMYSSLCPCQQCHYAHYALSIWHCQYHHVLFHGFTDHYFKQCCKVSAPEVPALVGQISLLGSTSYSPYHGVFMVMSVYSLLSRALQSFPVQIFVM